MVVGPNTFKPLPTYAVSPLAPQHTTAGGGDGALQHMGHTFAFWYFSSPLYPKLWSAAPAQSGAGYRLDTAEKTFTCKRECSHSPQNSH